jgi:hypothetical protein
MLEATPGKPWGIEFKELLKVEPDMKLRYSPSYHLCCQPPLTWSAGDA